MVERLRAEGFAVYDFKNPEPGNHGFHWSEIGPNWQSWSAAEFRDALNHPIAEEGFENDMDALAFCDACVLVNPCGRSAHLELGQAVGTGKSTFILLADGDESELMYRMAEHLCLDLDELVDLLKLWFGLVPHPGYRSN